MKGIGHRSTLLPRVFSGTFATAVALSCASTAASSSTMLDYEASFKTPWTDSAEGLHHLEHVNIYVPRHAPAKQLYYDVLGLAPDARRAQNIEKGSGTIWANIGISQIHLPEGDPQVVPGRIGLVYTDLADVVSRLKGANRDALEGTDFAWKVEDGGIVDVTCPYGNNFRLYKRKPVVDRSSDDAGPFDSRGGCLPSISHSGVGVGVGMPYVHFRVKPGTTAGIAQFYREMFGAEVEEVGAVGGDGDGGEASCSAVSQRAEAALAAGAVVRVGPVQHLGFWEGTEALPEYDGHHICVYLSDEGFRRSFVEAERRGIVFVNPRRNFGKADTLDKALEEKQYRIKDMVHPETGEVLHVLEHEIRSVSHPSYPVGRDLSVEP